MASYGEIDGDGDDATEVVHESHGGAEERERAERRRVAGHVGDELRRRVLQVGLDHETVMSELEVCAVGLVLDSK